MSAAAVATAHTAAATTTTSSSSSPAVVKSKTEDVSEKKPAASATTKLTNCVSSAEPKDSSAKPETNTDPLPADLNMILTEVARTGQCPWLSWNGRDPPEAPMPPDVQAAVSNSGGKSSGGSSSSRPVFAKHRPSSSAFSSFSSRSGAPVRKKLRNGVHVNRRRISDNGSSVPGTGGNASAAAGRKRPLYVTRTPSTTGSTFSASSIGSGRTSGSEVEDSTQYECDSEGTSATTNSELSVGERRAARKRVIVQTSPGLTPTLPPTEVPVCRYKTLREAMRSALGLVLDNSYRNRGGYKLSPAELRIHAAAVAAQSAASNAIALAEAGNGGSGKENNPELDLEPPSPEKTFQQRRRRLLSLLGEDSDSSEQQASPHSPLHRPSYLGVGSDFLDGPPFTIQRIAEVLVAPERYYNQTHKLCNCLEKLLLVTSPASSFGQSKKSETSQSNKGGENELTVTSDKKGRSEMEPRNKRLKRRMSSSSSDDENAQKSSTQNEKSSDEASGSKQPGSDDMKEESGESRNGQKEGQGASQSNGSEKISKEMLEAAARAQLRSKFDHVGIDPHSAVDRSVPGIPGNRGMTSSPPPPGLAMASAARLSPHGAVSGFGRHVCEQNGDSSSDSTPHPSTVQQNPMPFFAAANENATPIPAMHANQTIPLVQMHHEAAKSPLELVVVGPDANATSSGAPAASAQPPSDVADLDVEPGRSSASNSDVDSESDDFYLDDSASDRSDGSDSGHCEPFTAARVMALNRIQQQRSMQNRNAHQTTLHYQHGYGFRPPLDTEYQSGDSIDSTMAEDSCGSDSSSASDLAD